MGNVKIGKKERALRNGREQGERGKMSKGAGSIDPRELSIAKYGSVKPKALVSTNTKRRENKMRNKVPLHHQRGSQDTERCVHTTESKNGFSVTN